MRPADSVADLRVGRRNCPVFAIGGQFVVVATRTDRDASLGNIR